MTSLSIPPRKSKELGMLLRDIRQGLSLTQQQVADAIDIPAEVYGRVERGGMIPSVAALQKLCLRLGLDYASVVAQMKGGREDTALD
ncbi:helix-turn-helix domain-containing protein [Archangium sp.]|uniref:helix-turn-helix domain-containing protein n=1 Tax=Archangium sp. TaxID=1872627 RepID=UPI00389A06EE